MNDKLSLDSDRPLTIYEMRHGLVLFAIGLVLSALYGPMEMPMLNWVGCGCSILSAVLIIVAHMWRRA